MTLLFADGFEDGLDDWGISGTTTTATNARNGSSALMNSFNHQLNKVITAPAATALQASPKQYVDAKAPLVLGPSTPVPGGTPAGTVIVRTAT